MERQDKLARGLANAARKCLVAFGVLFASALVGLPQAIIGAVGLPIGATFAVILGGLLVAALCFGAVSGHLERPRKHIVSGVAASGLQTSLRRFEEAQLEYVRFYLTPDWRAARSTVIRRDGRVCKRCGRHIVFPWDVTVDHIRPRSKFPHLALELSNLQVLCRPCNSSKGATV
jgi:5-methylcytosine-specific restriction endonuclease McrA